MKKERGVWSWHKQALGAPSYLGVSLCIIAPLEGNYWYLFPLMVVVLFAYDGLYEYLFNNLQEKWITKGLVNCLTLIGFQLAFWAALFYFTFADANAI